MLRTRRSWIKAALLVAAVVVFRAGLKCSIPFPNRGLWQHFFSNSDFQHPEIEKELNQLQCVLAPTSRLNFEKPERNLKLAAYGVDALPYLLKLAGQQKIEFLVPTHEMVLPVGIIRPCYDPVCRIVHEIRDPRAEPYFRQMLKEDDLRLQAIAKSFLSELEKGKK